MKKNLQNIFSYLESDLIERTVPVRLSLLAALCGEHLLLLGPPGTAKSQLARKLHKVFSNASYFERLLTRFSVPEELFGPLSIKALEEDRYQRLTKHYLPEASIAFIDEIFKSNSAILNSLLTLLNEREFDNGASRVKTPLISVIAASNELPEEEGLEALYDRFLLRYQVKPVSDEGFDSLLNLSTPKDSVTDFKPVSLQDIQQLKTESSNISLDKQAHNLLHGLRKYLHENNIYISDRRWRKAFNLLQVAAFTNEQSSISQWDCVLLSHLMWQSPDQLDDINGWFKLQLNLDIESAIKRIEKLVMAWEAQLDEDDHKHTQKTNTHGEYLYTSPEGKATTQHERVTLAERDGEVLYLAPSDQKERTNNGTGYTLAELEKVFFDESYKQTHIDGRWVDVQNYTNNTQNRLVEKIAFKPIVDAFYFSSEYVENQRSELLAVIDDVSSINKHFDECRQVLDGILLNHLWISTGFLVQSLSSIKSLQPRLIDFQQRLTDLIKINAELKTKSSKINI